jgi:hypothetical protein
LNWDHDKEICKIARSLAEGSQKPPVTICLVVLGEVFLTIQNDLSSGTLDEDKAQSAIHRLNELKRRDRIRLCGLGNHSGGDEDSEDGLQTSLGYASRLHQEDSNLDLTDILIVSTALACPTCDVFFTPDTKILQSAAVKRLASEVDLTITEYPDRKKSKGRR